MVTLNAASGPALKTGQIPESSTGCSASDNGLSLALSRHSALDLARSVEEVSSTAPHGLGYSLGCHESVRVVRDLVHFSLPPTLFESSIPPDWIETHPGRDAVSTPHQSPHISLNPRGPAYLSSCSFDHTTLSPELLPQSSFVLEPLEYASIFPERNTVPRHWKRFSHARSTPVHFDVVGIPKVATALPRSALLFASDSHRISDMNRPRKPFDTIGLIHSDVEEYAKQPDDIDAATLHHDASSRPGAEFFSLRFASANADADPPLWCLPEANDEAREENDQISKLWLNSPGSLASPVLQDDSLSPATATCAPTTMPNSPCGAPVVFYLDGETSRARHVYGNDASTHHHLNRPSRDANQDQRRSREKTTNRFDTRTRRPLFSKTNRLAARTVIDETNRYTSESNELDSLVYRVQLDCFTETEYALKLALCAPRFDQSSRIMVDYGLSFDF